MMRLETNAIIAAGQSIGRAGIAAMLKLEANFSEILESGSLDEALALFAVSVGLIVLDMALPGLTRLADLEAIRRKFSGARLVVLVEDDNRDRVLQVLSAGASAIVPASATTDEIRFAFRQVLHGGMFVPPSLAEVGAAAAPSPPPGRRRRLTDRQEQIVEMIGRGCSKKDVAEALGITEATVKTHVHRAFRKLDVHRRLDAASQVAKGPGKRRHW